MNARSRVERGNGRPNPPIAASFFLASLTTLLVSLKFTRAIDWSWAWVLSPLWIGSLIGLAGLLVWLGSQEREGES